MSVNMDRPPSPDQPIEALPSLDLAGWLKSLRPLGPAKPRGDAPRRSNSTDLTRRAAAYLATIPPAVAGNQGHNRTYHAACVLVKGFNLSVDDARPLLEEWNNQCIPPWSPRELEHKLQSAACSPDDKTRGYLLEKTGTRAENPRGGLPNTWTKSANRFPSTHEASTPKPSSGDDSSDKDRTPHALAKRYLTNRFLYEGGIGLRFWRDEFHQWDSSSYRPIPVSDLKASVSGFLAELFAAMHLAETQAALELQPEGKERASNKLPRPIPVTGHLVADVIQALGSLVVLPSSRFPHQPAWIDATPKSLVDSGLEETAPAWPLDEILPARNMLVHLPSYVDSPDYPLAEGPRPADSFDERPWSMPPTPCFFHASALEYDFDPSPDPPFAWLEFLDRIWGDDDGSISCLQEWFGYLLHGDTRQQKILMMVGPKRSGRGTIARVLKALAGSSNVVNPTLTTLSRPFGLASLIGKPIAVFPDARLSGRPDNAAIVECLLSISGEDDQTIDRKHLPAWTGRLPTRFVLISNELPKLRDASGALSSRLIILRFMNSFYGNEDTTLIDRLLAELPGILMWSIQGWDRLRRRGRFVQPRSAMELVATMDDLASPIAAFLRDRCIMEPTATIPVGELYQAWRDWCGSHGREITGDEHSFGRDLHAAIPGLSKTRPRNEDGGRIFLYKGVRLRSLLDPDEYIDV